MAFADQFYNGRINDIFPYSEYEQRIEYLQKTVYKSGYSLYG